MRLRNQLIIVFVLIANLASAYGPIGHRAIATIAELYLTDTAKQQIKELLDGDGIVIVATYADDIRSDKKYDYTSTWHYVNAKDDETYKESKKNPNGDVISAINESIAILKDPKSSKEEKAFRLKLLVHFIGDLHQPMHAGHAEDLGGNTIKVTWHKKPTNLHKVWDSNLIESQKMSYSEIAATMKQPPYIDIKRIQKGDVVSWYNESKELSKKIYASVKPNENLSYKYSYTYYPIQKQRLNYAGIRLAKVLNDIFK
jgi:hypothetical protein